VQRKSNTLSQSLSETLPKAGSTYNNVPMFLRVSEEMKDFLGEYKQKHGIRSESDIIRGLIKSLMG